MAAYSRNNTSLLNDFIKRVLVSPQTVVEEICFDFRPTHTDPEVGAAINGFLVAAHNFVELIRSHIGSSQGGGTIIPDRSLPERSIPDEVRQSDNLMVVSDGPQQNDVSTTARPDVGLFERSVDQASRINECQIRESGRDLPRSSTPSLLIATDGSYFYDEGVLVLRPSQTQYEDFPSLLDTALSLGAKGVGAFKIELPQVLRRHTPFTKHARCTVSAFKSRTKARGVFALDRYCVQATIHEGEHQDISVKDAERRFETCLQEREGFKHVYYRTDLDADTVERRRMLGLPDRSPIWPLKGDQLPKTKSMVPGIHYPYGYISGAQFGAPFCLHRDDGDLFALNVLYVGCKVWTVTSPRDALNIEKKHRLVWKHEHECVQSVRHYATMILPEQLRKWATCTTFRQRPNEVVVVLPQVYHQGFSTGTTLAEAVNYAPPGWSIRGYKECQSDCPGYPIPNSMMEISDHPDSGAYRKPENNHLPTPKTTITCQPASPRQLHDAEVEHVDICNQNMLDIPCRTDDEPTTSIIHSSLPSRASEVRYDKQEGLLRLHPTKAQYQEFPDMIKTAVELGADKIGVFKIVLPKDMISHCQVVSNSSYQVSVFKQTMKEDGIYQLHQKVVESAIMLEASEKQWSIDEALREFEALLANPSGLSDVYYCNDYEARNIKQRRDLGLPEISPIWPLKGNELDNTKVCIPGLHYPFGYKSSPKFGAPSAIRKEDFDTYSLNKLDHGCKVWTVVAPADAAEVERRLQAVWKHSYKCAQSIRHCATLVTPDMLRGWARCVSFRQLPNEVVVIFPRAYHTGFSTGSSLGEAVNYAPAGWTSSGYSGCSDRCPGYPIPNAYMEFCSPDEAQQEHEEQSEPDEGQVEHDEQEELVSVAQSKLRKQGDYGVRKRTSKIDRITNKKLKRDLLPPEHRQVEKQNSKRNHCTEIPLETAMARAIGSPAAFLALKQVLMSVPKSHPADLLKDDPQKLLALVEYAERSETRHAYLRRFALARLAESYMKLCPNKMEKAAAYENMIQQIWNVPYPVEDRGKPKTKSGLIDSTTPMATIWNKHKRHLSGRIESGHRWLELAHRHGWSTLALITRDWDSAASNLNLNDTVFEQKLKKADFESVLRAISATRSQFLHMINRSLKSNLLEVIADPSRASDWEIITSTDTQVIGKSDEGLIKLLQPA